MSEPAPALPRLRSEIESGVLGKLVYARFSLRGHDVDVGGAIGPLLLLARQTLGPVVAVQARGQWIGEAGALTLTLDHPAGAVSLIDVSAACVRPSFLTGGLTWRIEGDRGTAQLLADGVLRLSGQGWRREERVVPAELPVEEDDPEMAGLVERALRAAETGEVT